MTGPGASGQAVGDIPLKHHFNPTVDLGAPIQQHRETAVDHLAPTDPAAIVKTSYQKEMYLHF